MKYKPVEEERDLFWFAINYRTAGLHSAQGEWIALEAYFDKQMQAAFDAGRASRDAEVEALRADAERYRHLRSQFRTEWLHNGVDYGRGREIVSSYARVGVELPRTFARIGHSNSYKVSAETIDQAIDAAIAASKERDQHGENFGVVVGFTDEGIALVDYPSEGNTISLEEGMILYPLAAGRAAQEAEK